MLRARTAACNRSAKKGVRVSYGLGVPPGPGLIVDRVSGHGQAPVSAGGPRPAPLGQKTGHADGPPCRSQPGLLSIVLQNHASEALTISLEETAATVSFVKAGVETPGQIEAPPPCPSRSVPSPNRIASFRPAYAVGPSAERKFVDISISRRRQLTTLLFYQRPNCYTCSFVLASYKAVLLTPFLRWTLSSAEIAILDGTVQGPDEPIPVNSLSLQERADQPILDDTIYSDIARLIS
jgi:hypothetical protein